MAEDLKLYRTWSSVFGLRPALALKMKKVEYENMLEDLSNKSDALLEYNPVHKKIPVLVHNGKPICESLVILEYIDETWKQSPLLPQDPYQKALARFWAKFGEEKVWPPIVTVFRTQGKEQEKAIVEALENLKFVEEQLIGKKFFGGETIGYLDLAFAWIANFMSILEELIGREVLNADEFPLLSAWMINFADDPVIKECWPPRDKVVEKYKATSLGHRVNAVFHSWQYYVLL